MTDRALAKPAIAPADLWTFLLLKALATVLRRSDIAVYIRRADAGDESVQSLGNEPRAGNSG